tara:strand:- start:51 stop:743 length:693 start_codon:yes stop_codon:yes gene_type:complete
MRTLLLSIILIISSNLIGQVTGVYKGLDHYATYKNDKGEEYKRFNDKQLTLNKDSTFQFWSIYRTSNAVCIGCIDTLWVDGNWTKTKDTLYLNSRYQATDFIKIIDFKSDNKKKTFIYNTNTYNYCRHPDLLIINDSIRIDFNCCTSITKEIETVNSIKFIKNREKNIIYEFNYKPRSLNPNIFTFNFDFTPFNDYNDSFFTNTKFIINDNVLIPFKNKGLVEVEKGYEK